MKKSILLYATLLTVMNIYSQTFTKLTTSGSNREIEWVTSDYGNGFGHKIYNYDPGGTTLLNIAARHNSSSWIDVLSVTSDAKIGLGTTSPSSKLDVIGRIRTRTIAIDDPSKALDWNELWQSGFYESYEGTNAPEPYNWFWGIVMNHSTNNSDYKYSGQIAVKNDSQKPVMYFRSTNREGEGIWAKVLHNKGNQAVNGKLEAKEIKVTTTPTADFVFDEEYEIPSLEFIDTYIKENKHLPEIASAKEMEKNGVNIGEFQIKLLQKIEELTLYTIEQHKLLKSQEVELQTQMRLNNNLEEKINQLDENQKRIEMLLKTIKE